MSFTLLFNVPCFIFGTTIENEYNNSSPTKGYTSVDSRGYQVDASNLYFKGSSHSSDEFSSTGYGNYEPYTWSLDVSISFTNTICNFSVKSFSRFSYSSPEVWDRLSYTLNIAIPLSYTSVIDSVTLRFNTSSDDLNKYIESSINTSSRKIQTLKSPSNIFVHGDFVVYCYEFSLFTLGHIDSSSFIYNSGLSSQLSDLFDLPNTSIYSQLLSNSSSSDNNYSDILDLISSNQSLSLDQLNSILDAINSVQVDTDSIYSELGSISQNISTLLEYLTNVDNPTYYNIDTESIPIVSYFLNLRNKTDSYVSTNGLGDLSYINYPLVTVGVNKSSLANLRGLMFCYLDFNFILDNVSIIPYIYVYYNSSWVSLSDYMNSASYINFSSNYLYCCVSLSQLAKISDDVSFYPIYYILPNDSNFSLNDLVLNVSTDFALKYGFSNTYLSNINGDSSSNESNNKLNDITNNFNDTSSKFNDIEKEFTNDLDSNLNSIDTSTDFSFNGGGSYFKNSINWVNTQFNKMTNSTPFGSILGFSLILGLALLLLGKLFK